MNANTQTDMRCKALQYSRTSKRSIGNKCSASGRHNWAVLDVVLVYPSPTPEQLAMQPFVQERIMDLTAMVQSLRHMSL